MSKSIIQIIVFGKKKLQRPIFNCYTRHNRTKITYTLTKSIFEILNNFMFLLSLLCGLLNIK